VKAHTAIAVPKHHDAAELDPAHPTDRAKLALVEAILDAPELPAPPKYFHIGQAFTMALAEVRRVVACDRFAFGGDFDAIVERHIDLLDAHKMKQARALYWTKRPKRFGPKSAVALLERLGAGWSP
jgi:hypothetical protein